VDLKRWYALSRNASISLQHPSLPSHSEKLMSSTNHLGLCSILTLRDFPLYIPALPIARREASASEFVHTSLGRVYSLINPYYLYTKVVQ
jgi:hypothetical protein